MTKAGVLYICDRCGKEKFVPNGEVLCGVPADWSEHESKQLCSYCTDLYNNFYNTFFAPEVKRGVYFED